MTADGENSSDGRIVVSRATGYRDAMRKYRIEVDGEPVGELGPGEEIIIPSTDGPHLVRGRIDWTGSPEVEVMVSTDHSPSLVVSAHGSLLKAILQVRIVGRNRYLQLEGS